MGSYIRVGFIIGITLLTVLGTVLMQQVVYAAVDDGAQIFSRKAAPMATSEDSVYIV